MPNTSKTIVFFGSGPVAAASLDFLADHFEIETVITKAVPPHHKDLAPVEALAKKLKLPLRFASNKKELDEAMKQHSLNSLVGIVVDYGVIMSREVIDAFPLGIVNSHFSLLPEWRGADPITFSILSGQPKTGVSLMVIEPTLDTGKLITQKVLPIAAGDTTVSLTKKLIELSNQLLGEYLPRYIEGDITPKNQPHPDRATHSRKLTKQDGVIDWTKPAATIEREIRAFVDWPQSRTTLGSVEVIITKAHALPSDFGVPGQLNIEGSSVLTVQTGEGSLGIDTLKPIGKKEMPVSAFLRGYRSKLS